jgi:hypothetical protein
LSQGLQNMAGKLSLAFRVFTAELFASLRMLETNDVYGPIYLIKLKTGMPLCVTLHANRD